MSESVTGLSKRREILIKMLPLGAVIIIGMFIYYFTVYKNEDKGNEKVETVVNSSLVNRNMADSFGSKSDLYLSTENKALEEKHGQEVLQNGNDHLDIVNDNASNKVVNTNNNPEDIDNENLRKRMKKELAKPANMYEPSTISSPIYEEQIPILTAITKKKSKKVAPTTSTESFDDRNSEFNSFSFTKKVSPLANNTNSHKSTQASISNTEINTTNPSDYIETINCPAYVLHKTKINGNTTLVVELMESMILPNGKTVDKGTRIAGSATINDTRVSLSIQTINVNGKIESQSLTAYDLDGMEGLMVKGARAQSGTSNTINGTLNSAASIGEGILGLPGQLAGGIFRSVLGTGRGGSVVIPAGYKLILKMN